MISLCVAKTSRKRFEEISKLYNNIVKCDCPEIIAMKANERNKDYFDFTVEVEEGKKSN